MFCPNCKTEYRDGFSKCSDCGDDLVRELPRQGKSGSSEFTELVWMGTDYFAHTAVKKLLAADGIRYSERPPADYMLFPASFRASAVYVSSNDLAPARLLIDARFLERDEDDEQLKVNGPDGSEVEKAPEDDDDTSAVPPDVAPTVPEDWNSRLATCTIWRTDLIEAM